MEMIYSCRSLEGKVAVITGAASKMGEAIARKFFDHGVKVILADVRFSECQNIAEDLISKNKARPGEHAKAVKCDITNPSEIKNLIDEARLLGGLDIWYNHVEADKDVSPTNLDIFRNTMRINVESVLEIIRQASREMIGTHTKGCIICTGSTVGLLDDVVPSAYSISKTALVGVVRAAAAELGGRGVRVNAITPHRVVPSYDRDALRHIYPRVTDHPRLDDMIRNCMTKRLARDEDVANAAVYLASHQSVNGHNLVLNGIQANL
jgi:NAD(P)-dependent dehydrogenase (short-subunit alcohol dehydrogenase family)